MGSQSSQAKPSKNSYKILFKMFKKDTNEAVDLCKKEICENQGFSSFEQFVEYHKEHAQVSTCQRSWPRGRMSIHCFTCSISTQSCICPECFLEGNHEGHDYCIRGNSSGNCDCGDSNLWKPSGFCKNHKGIAPDANPQDYLDEEFRNLILKLFTTAFEAVFFFARNQDEDQEGSKVKMILNFMKVFLKFGDGFRRLITIALTEKIDFSAYIKDIILYSRCHNDLLADFFGYLLNDTLFIINFAKSNYKYIPLYTNLILNESNGDQIRKRIKPLSHHFFHSFSSYPLQTCVSNNSFQWDTFALAIYNINLMLIQIDKKVPEYLSEINLGLKRAATHDPSSIQKLFDKIVLATHPNLRLETKFQEKYEMNTSRFIIMSFNLREFYSIFSVNFEELNISSLLTQISKSDFISCNSSFYNGETFYFLYPLLMFLESLFTHCKNSYQLFDKFRLITNNQNTFEKVVIALLKHLTSFYASRFSLASIANNNIINLLNCFNDSPIFHHFSQFSVIGLLQFILGISSKTNKEFILRKMALLLGVFDDQSDDNESKSKPTNTIFLFLVLVFTLDRTVLFNRKREILEKQLIFTLKAEGQCDMPTLKQAISDDYIKHSITEFHTILKEIAFSKKKQHEDVVVFFLKDNIKWNPINSVNPSHKQINYISSILQKQNKSSSGNHNLLELAPFDDLSAPEKGSLNFQEIVFSPTVLGVCYQTIANSSKDICEIDIHLALNIILLASQFSQSFSAVDLNSKYPPKGDFLNINELFDFNFSDFQEFFFSQISLKGTKPTSIYSLIKSLGSLGQDIFEKMGLQNHEKEETHHNDLENKEKAKQLKASILKQFNESISNSPFLQTQSNFSDNENIESDEDPCSICGTKIENELLLYPTFMYRNSIISKINQLDAEVNDPEQYNNSVIQFNICHHAVHLSCALDDNDNFEIFKCPIDRSFRNTYIPAIDCLNPTSPITARFIHELYDSVEYQQEDLDNTISKNIRKAFSLFFSYLQRSFLNNDNDYQKSMVEMIKSLSGLIILYDARLRNLPSSLDNKNTKLLSRNLFLLTNIQYHILKKENNSFTIPKENFSPFELFVCTLVETDIMELQSDSNNSENLDTITSFLKNQVKNIGEKLNGKIMTQFMRRTLLSEYFYLLRDVSPFSNDILDWDDFLSNSYLCQYYDIKNNPTIEYSFEPLTFIHNPPKNFLNFLLPPFNYPISETSECNALDIVSGNVRKFEGIDVYLTTLTDETNIYLMLSKEASAILVTTHFAIGNIEPFYVDSLGNPNISYSTGAPIFFSEDRYEKFIDTVLSGSFCKDLNRIDEEALLHILARYGA